MQLLGLTASEVQKARDKFYPGWWSHFQVTNYNLMPYYRVVCYTQDEFTLAKKVKPSFVRAEIELTTTSQFSLNQAKQAISFL